MEKENTQILKRIEGLLTHLVVIQLHGAGVSQQLIAKHLKVSKSTVNDFLKGVTKGKEQSEDSKP